MLTVYASKSPASNEAICPHDDRISSRSESWAWFEQLPKDEPWNELALLKAIGTLAWDLEAKASSVSAPSPFDSMSHIHIIAIQ